jgi:hypothetical protein
MRTKEQIRQYNKMAQRTRRASTPTGQCACGRSAKYWTSDYQRECERCRQLETVKWTTIGATEKPLMNEADRAVYVPLYKRFKVSIQEMANAILVHAHGDYTLKIQ